MNELPQHPARQQGLGSPIGNERPQQAQNPYVKENVALTAANANVLKAAQAEQALAQADKLRSEQAILQGLGTPAPQSVEAGPTVTPQEVQAQQVAEGIVAGSVSEERLMQMVQSGEIDESTASAAVGMANQVFDAREAEQLQGLGGI